MKVAARCGFFLAVGIANTPMLAAQAVTQYSPISGLAGGTRSMALGGAFVAGDGPEVLFHNPAQIGLSRNTTISWQGFGSAAALASLATSTSLLGASIGVGVQYLEYGAVDYTGNANVGELNIAGSQAASSIVGALAASIERKGIRVGATFKYLQQQLPLGRSSRPAFDLGFATNVSRVTIGLAVLDADGLLARRLPPQLALPTRITMGAAAGGFPLGLWFDIGGMASVTVEQGGRFVPAGGVELTYFRVSGWSLVGRIGARRVRNNSIVLDFPDYRGYQARGESPVTLGASVNADRLSVDYAFQQFRGPGDSHRLGVRIRP